jgi:hypothetical protein
MRDTKCFVSNPIMNKFLNCLSYTVSNWRLNVEMEKMWKEATRTYFVVIFLYLPALVETMTYFSQDGQFPSMTL